jgi:hypothetical protein
VAWPRLQLQEKHFESFYESNLPPTVPTAVGCQFKVPVALLVRVPPVKVKPPPPLGPARTPSTSTTTREMTGHRWAESGTCKDALSFLHSCSSHIPTHQQSQQLAAELPREWTESLLLDRNRNRILRFAFPALSAGTTTCTLVHLPLTTHHSPLILAPFDGEKVIVRKGQGPDLMR